MTRIGRQGWSRRGWQAAAATAGLLLVSGCVGMPGYGTVSTTEPSYGYGYGYAPTYGYGTTYATPYAPGYGMGYGYAPGYDYVAPPAAGFGGMFVGGGGRHDRDEWHGEERHDRRGYERSGEGHHEWRGEAHRPGGHEAARSPAQPQPHWPMPVAGNGRSAEPAHAPPARPAPPRAHEDRSVSFPAPH